LTTFLHLGWCLLFITKWEMGVAGAALALNVTYIMNYLLQEYYIRSFAEEKFAKFLQPLFTH
jgi:Na+-driven multidrug efflux pump